MNKKYVKKCVWKCTLVLCEKKRKREREREGGLRMALKEERGCQKITFTFDPHDPPT